MDIPRMRPIEVQQKANELEESCSRLPCRICKSTIVNVNQIYSLEKSFSVREFLSDPQAGPYQDATIKF